MSSWDAELQQLLHLGRITGYALISQEGNLQCAYGSLEKYLWNLSTPQRISRVSQYYEVFKTSYSPTHLCVGDQQAIICRQTENSILGVSRGKQVAVFLVSIPSGILVVCFGKPNFAQSIVPEIERICGVLHKP